jgi:hypothetical protein
MNRDRLLSIVCAVLVVALIAAWIYGLTVTPYR